MRKLILILLFFIPAISLAQNATITQSAQRSIEAAQFHQNLAILFVIISIFANKIIFISNYLLQTQPDINLFQLITIFFKKRKGVKLKITDQGNAPISLIKTSIVDKTDNLISTNYSDFKGMVNLAVPQDGSIIVSGFGFEKRIIHRKTKKGEEYLGRVVPSSVHKDSVIFDAWIYKNDVMYESISRMKLMDVTKGRMKPPDWIVNSC